MGKRTITVEVEVPDNQAYTDLAHAIWAVAYVAVGEGVRVVADEHADVAAMNLRWLELGRDVPWS